MFEQAHKGTLYFDEICDLPMETQGKIVRAVTEQRFRRIGGNKEVSVDVRVISAQAAISLRKSGLAVREDLYYRLGVVPLTMPPLADRREDIPHLARHFVDLVARRTGLPRVKLGDEVLAAMQGYHWLGNVRQMLNTIENMVIMAPTDRSQPLGLDLLPAEIQNISPAAGNSDIDALLALRCFAGGRPETSYMAAQLQRFDGNVSQMAGFVGMERSALHRQAAVAWGQPPAKARIRRGWDDMKIVICGAGLVGAGIARILPRNRMTSPLSTRPKRRSSV